MEQNHLFQPRDRPELGERDRARELLDETHIGHPPAGLFRLRTLIEVFAVGVELRFIGIGLPYDLADPGDAWLCRARVIEEGLFAEAHRAQVVPRLEFANAVPVLDLFPREVVDRERRRFGL